MSNDKSGVIFGRTETTTPRFLPLSAWAGHLPFAFWIVEALRPRVFVELGVFGGASYCAFCQAVSQLDLSTSCFGVDTWQGDAHTGTYDSTVLNTLRAHHDPLYSSFSRLIRSTFDDASHHFAPRSIDLLHIDGYHTYEAVKGDFETWSDKLSERAIVIFHDTKEHANNFGAWKFWDEIRRDKPHFSFLHAHGLGVLGVGRELPSPVNDLFALDQLDTAKVREHFDRLGQPFHENSEYMAAERGSLIAEIGRYHVAITEANERFAASELTSRAGLGELRDQLGQAHTHVAEANNALTSERAEAQKMVRDLEVQLGQTERKVVESNKALALAQASIASGEVAASALRDGRMQERLRAVDQIGKEMRHRHRSWWERAASVISPRSRRQAAIRHGSDDQAQFRYCFDVLLESWIFDETWYVSQNEDISASGQEAWAHFRNHGLHEGRSPNPFFDPSWYLDKYPDVAASGENPLIHYLFFGVVDRRDPGPDFDVDYFTAEHPEAAANPLRYHLEIGRAQGWRTSAPVVPNEHVLWRIFDPAWYLVNNPDLQKASRDPWSHFIEFGLDENRAPNPYFDPAWYAEQYPDVVGSGKNFISHYLEYGAREERDPGPNFAASYYAAVHPECSDNPLIYHLEFGQHLGWATIRKMDAKSHLDSTESPFLAPDVEVDIIIPVYRGLEETRSCLQTVLADRSRPQGEIIVVNDRSPEPALSLYLAELAEAGEIRLLCNEVNLGFVASVNRGMEAARGHDVVLLNSDTEVPEGWLRRLAAQAYSAPKIGSVTPFSNNATICSYPCLPGGALPEGRLLAELDAAAARANSGRNIDIPTAVGFAMYIRRACLDEIGPFDVETFGTGYGEENDFCLRASARGWKHLLACDVFVFHKGEVSFGAKSAQRDRAWDLLVARYPEYPRLVARHIKLDEAAPYRFAATSALVSTSGKPVILLVLHALGGGTERHFHDLVAAMRDRAELLLLKPYRDGVSLSFATLDGLAPLTFLPSELGDLVSVLQAARVERVHVHHVFGFKINVRELIHQLGVPFDFTAHDYYSICPQITLVSSVTDIYCGEPDASGCAACIKTKVSVDAADIITWRWSQRWLLTEAERVICPSRDIEQRLTRYGMRNGIVALHEPVVGGVWPITLRPIAPGEPLRVAVIGVLSKHKGAAAVLGCASAVSASEIEFVLIGRTDQDVAVPEGASFRQTGSYSEDELPQLLEEVSPHLIWFPAPWPETYSYTLSAAIKAGLPIVATDIGAFPERLDGHPWIWFISPDADTHRWLQAFQAARTAILLREAPRAERPMETTEDFYKTRYLVEGGRPATQPTRSALVDLRRAGCTSVLVVLETMGGDTYSPCAYIRILLPLRRIANEANMDLTLVSPAESLRYRADAVVLHRYSPGSYAQGEEILDHCRLHDMRVIYDLDDNLLEVSDEHPEADRLRAESKLIELFVDRADVVIASTKPLKAYLDQRRSVVLLMENAIDDEILAPRSNLREPSETDRLRIICMGTSTHDADFAMIEPVLRRLDETFGSRIAIDLIGVTQSNDLPRNVTRMAVPATAHRTYPAFLRWLSEQEQWDVGISPLKDTVFNQSKSYIKAIDYMVSGAVPLVSDVPAYAGLPHSAVLRVANSADAWFDALAQLLADPERRIRLRRAGEDCLHERFTLSAQQASRVSTWKQILAGHTPGQDNDDGAAQRGAVFRDDQGDRCLASCENAPHG